MSAARRPQCLTFPGCEGEVMPGEGLGGEGRGGGGLMAAAVIHLGRLFRPEGICCCEVGWITP